MLEDFLEARASFKTKITPRVDEIPFLIRELTFKPQTSATFLKAKRKKMHFSLSAQIYSAPNYLNEATYNVRGTLLIDTNKSLLYVYGFVYSLFDGRLDVS